MVSETILPASPITANVVFISNTLFALEKILESTLQNPGETLRTIVVIPSNPIKNLLMQHLTDSLGGCFGIRFLTLPQAIEHFIRISYSRDLNFPSFSKLSLHIESLLLSDIGAPLLAYLQQDKGRMRHFAGELAHLFLHHGVYGNGSFTDETTKELWESVSRTWDFPCNTLRSPPNPRFPLKVFLFGVEHIPSLYRKFLDELSCFWSISYFFRSPTPLYWGDLLSDKALAKADYSFQIKEVSLEERSAFETLASDRNSFLANFGSLGKSTFLWLSEKEVLDLFVPPKEDSSLTKLQSDIFSLSPMRPLENDSSIEIHETPSLLAEVELLFETIQSLLASGSFLPSDIVVLAPDLNVYFPYVQFVFQSLGYVLSDLSSDRYNPYLKTLDLFFSLVESRFEVETVEELIFSEAIVTHQNFSSEERSLMRQILSEMNIRWGLNEEMKKEVLGAPSVSPRGSWQFAFQQILESLPFQDSFEISKFEMLGKLILFLETLFSDLFSLKHKESPLEEWIVSLDTLLHTYFPLNDELLFVLKELHHLGLLAKKLHTPFSFASIHPLLKEIFAKKSFEACTRDKPQILFANLEHGCLFESKALFLLGMSEDLFPRKKTVRSLSDFGLVKDRCPENPEKDRYFFLQALLSAKNRCIISYVGISKSDGKPLLPSLCVEELLSLFKENPLQKHFFSFPTKEGLPKNHLPIREVLTGAKPKSLDIDVRHLVELVRHPVRFYANRVLGLFLERNEDEDSKEFFLSHLDKAKVFETFIHHGKEEVLPLLEKKNILPTALFEKGARLEILQEIKEIESGLQTFDLTKEDFFSLHLDPLCKKPCFLDKNRFVHKTISSTLPDGTPFTLFGRLPLLTKKGVYVHKSTSIKEKWRYIPYLSILQYLESELPPYLLFGKDGNLKTPQFPLIALIEYYREAINAISPLLPETIEPILKQKGIQAPSTFFEDPYLALLTPDLSKNWEAIVCKNLIV